MCIVSDEIKEVTNTEILVAINKDEKEQLTVYSNKTVNYKTENFMILPVPTDVSDQIRFVDLTNIDVFVKLERLFSVNKGGYVTYSLEGNKEVEYHSVGSYDVYICRSLQAIENNFPINTKVTGLLSKYYSSGFSFLLCKLKSGKEYQYHPLAYVHKIKDQQLFIPTKHLHIHRLGEDYEKNYEHWDHNIYVYNYKGKIEFKNQVLVDFVDEADRVIQENRNENYFKLLGDRSASKVRMSVNDKVKIVSTVALPKIPFVHDNVESVNRFIIKNVFLNDDLVCSVY